MKYIRFKTIGFVVFPSRISHFTMAAKLNEYDKEPVSAGQIIMVGNQFVCGGNSITLGIESSVNDSAGLAEQMKAVNK